MTLIMSLAVSASCFAAGAAKNFAAEEKAADDLVNALTGNSVTYEQASKNFSAVLKKNLDAGKFSQMKKQISEKVGTIKNINFVTFVKQYNPRNGYNNIEELLYIGTVNKEKFARLVVIFALENNVPKVASFQITPVEAAKPKTAQKK